MELSSRPCYVGSAQHEPVPWDPRIACFGLRIQPCGCDSKRIARLKVSTSADTEVNISSFDTREQINEGRHCGSLAVSQRNRVKFSIINKCLRSSRTTVGSSASSASITVNRRVGVYVGLRYTSAATRLERTLIPLGRQERNGAP